ncbi:MAG: ATP-binding protein [Oscillospiraceae bacterium]|nr:ATP-binding protein [Oscillospiraceae bacterium]
MANNTFGAYIIEILTAGMYQDSKVIYREYIQNACNSIDKSEKQGILRVRKQNGKSPDMGEGEINIWLEPNKRYISIEDNAMGIKVDEFQSTLRRTADSDKVIGEDKGFRGIGKLCGLAYCKQLVFTSRYTGEDTVSIMSFDALKMREMINEAHKKIKRHSAEDVLEAMIEFSTRPAIKSDSEHFFKAELIDINAENEELFGGKDYNNTEKLKDYLSFVAPAPYQANFIYRSEIYKYAKENNHKFDEYVIKVNGEQIFKKYKTHIKTGNGQDDVFGVKFQDFIADDGSLLGWMWFGVTSFKAAIKREDISRGLRLRKENIQIGEEDVVRDLFTKDSSGRSNSYFIGEIFAVSSDLIPNSQRSYFNENPIRIEFESKLKDYFNNTLHHIYYEGSSINASIKKITAFKESAEEFAKKKEEGKFLNNEDFEKQEQILKAKGEEAEKAYKKLEKQKENGGKSILTLDIIARRKKEIPTVSTTKLPLNPFAADNKSDETIEPEHETSSYKTRKTLVDDMFPTKNKKERKLLADTLAKIFFIIENSADKKTSDEIIKRIKEELR